MPPARFGTGSGVLNMARQVGTVLGVAGLVAILAHLSPTDPIVTYQHALELIVAFFACAAVVAAGLLTGRAAPAGPPAVTAGSVPSASSASSSAGSAGSASQGPQGPRRLPSKEFDSVHRFSGR